MRQKGKPTRARQFKDDDTFSRLPVHVLHHILSFMPLKDAVRNAALSRTWLHAWNSIPVSTFKFVCNTEKLEETFPLATNFYDVLSILQKKEALFVNLHVSWPLFRNDLYENCIDEWMRLVTKHRLRELKIDVLPENVEDEDEDEDEETLEGYTLPCETMFAAAESLFVLRLRGCKMIRHSLRIEKRNFVALRVLFWEDDFMDDQSVSKLLPHCPILEECTLISVFKRTSVLHLCNCRKLKQVKLDGFKRVIIKDTPNLQVVDISNFCNIEGENCDDISKLTLKTCEDTNLGDLQYFVYKRPLLQSMVLNNSDMFHIAIASPSLETFSFSSDMWLPNVVICAPRLRCYEYQGSMLPEISMEANPSVCKKIELVLTPRRHDDTYLFFKCLRRKLVKLTEYNSILKLIINADEFEPFPLPSNERYLPTPAFIDSVELQHIWSPLVYSSLIKWVLWCCRPLNLSAYPSCLFLKVFQDIILHRLDDTKHCKDCSTCTCSNFTGVKVHTPYGIKDLKNLNIDDFYKLQSEGILKFQLEWQ